MPFHSGAANGMIEATSGVGNMTPSRFDVYGRSEGRWTRIDSVDGDARDDALARAANLDGAGAFDGIRVMAVNEYEGGRPPLETLAWISPHLSKTASVSRQLRNQANAALLAAGPDDVASLDDQGGRETLSRTEGEEAPRAVDTSKRPTDRRPSVAPKFALDVLGALVIGGVSFVAFAPLLKSLGSTIGIAGASQQKLTVAVSLIVFAIAASLLMIRTYKKAEADHVAKQRLTEANVRERAERLRRKAQTASAPTVASTVSAPTGAGKKDQPLVTTEPEAVVARGGGLNEGMRRDMLGFLAQALGTIKDQVPKMNRHIAFGLNLYISGAARKYGSHVSLNDMQSFVLVREMVEALGGTTEQVDTYCRRFAEYSETPSYLAMIEAGAAAMTVHIDGEGEPFADLPSLMRDWGADTTARATLQGIVCIMFTDIVGSNQMTHEKGDYGAQEVVRVHNAIVRSCLAAHHGKEVKHTGDGIMASFTVAGNAVRAALEIQKAFADHNASTESIPVNVRIGLNAGEAVEEENDFFGTTVQISARVCDKAGTGEVYVTESVRELSRGQGLLFEDAGTYEMKGVPEPLTLFRAGLRSIADSEAETASA